MLFFEAARRKRWRAKTNATWAEWWQWVIGHAIGIERQANFIECNFSFFTIDTKTLVYIG
ncbi:hypothetical protein D3C72_2479010 [compost metagenome]